MIAMLSCNQDKNGPEKRSPYHDIIHNPATADIDNLDTINIPKIRFEEKVFDFGIIHEGDIVEHEYTFRNVGKRDLIILDTKSTCGCTIPSYDDKPIPPGRKGKLTLRFDSNERKETQEKKVTIFTNSIPNKHELTIKGYVNPKL